MENPLECAVCLENIGSTNCTTTKCGHTFCFQCIGKVIVNNNNTCPLCRESLIDGIDTLEDDNITIIEDDYSSDSDNESMSEHNTVIFIKEGNVDYMTKRFKEAGYNDSDLMSLYLDKFQPTDAMSLEDQIWKVKKMRTLISEIETESESEEREQQHMENEDKNASTENIPNNVEIFRDLSSSVHNLSLQGISREEIEELRYYLSFP
uniref:RING-type domain-containing protein n=1 Tax=viral metagenome TaxID=1070528 RepID=A0A6C0C3B0_9ZZZZ